MSENALLASRIAELERQLSSANSRIAELERDEPNHDDIVALRKALTNAGIAGPESDEELAWKWLSYVRRIIRSVSEWEFVPAAERKALTAQVEALRNAASHILVQKRPDARRKAFAILTAVIKLTPQQCLNEIKAQAVRDFVYWGTVNLDPEFAEFEDCAETFVGLGCPSIPREVL